MKTKCTTHHGRLFASRVGVIFTQCVSLWCGFYLVLVLLTLAEWRMLRERGAEYTPKSSVQQVSVGAFSVSADARWAVSRMSFRRRAVYCSDVVNDIVVHDLKRQTVRRLYLGDMLPCGVVISPTAEALAIVCHDGSVYVATDAAGNVGRRRYAETRCLLRGSGAEVQCFVFSPNGRFLALARNREIHVLPVSADAPSCPPEDDGFVHLCSQAGDCGAWCGSGRSDAVSGHATSYQAVCDGACTSLAFTADSRQLVMLDCHAEVSRFDTGSGQPFGTRTLADQPAVRTALSADGRLAALVLANGTLHCWDLAADKKLWQRNTAILDFYQALPTAFEVSPDGRLLVTACWTDGKFGVDCYDTRTGACFESWPRYLPSFKGLAVTSAGLVYAWDSNGVIQAWNVARRGEHWRFSWVSETDR